MDSGMRWFGLMLVCSATLAVGCGMFESKPAEPPAAQAILPVAPAFLPADRAVDKLDRCDKVHNYNGDNLYLTLGPDAQTYRDYAVVELIQTKYRVGLDGVERLDVQVFRMKDNVNAFGAYSVQHNKDAEPVEVGTRACATDLTLDAYKGQYFVRLILDKAIPDSKDNLVKFGALIMSKLPGDKSLPAALSVFPTKNRVANGEEYLAAGMAGRTYLKGGYRVLYEVDGKKFTMFLCQFASPEEALWNMTIFRDSFKNSGAAEAVLPGPWMQGFWALDRDLGRAFVFQKGAFIGGTMGQPDKKLAGELSAQLANAIR